jgi:hypothetical protein
MKVSDDMKILKMSKVGTFLGSLIMMVIFLSCCGQVQAATVSNIPTIYSASGIKLDSVIKESGIKTDDGNPVTFKFYDEHTILILAVDQTVIGDLKLSVLDGDLYPTFDNSTEDIRIVLNGSDDGENGTIRLTVNQLTGADINGIPSDATSVANQNICVTDLIN